MKIKRAKSRIKIAIYCLLSLTCVAGLIFTSYRIIVWFAESTSAQEAGKALEQAAEIAEIDDTDKTEKIENNDDLYWKFIDTKLINVNIDELRRYNDEAQGWIQLKGTNINYPFVQTTNNDFYLSHNFYRENNTAGWVFADFRNRLDGTDKNTILYAHGRYDSTMFGTLRNILTSGWLNNPDNYTVRTVSTTESALWQVFSVYKIPTTNEYIQTDFTNDDDFGDFANMLLGRSKHDFKTSVKGSDQILTLSTCYNSAERVVLHAKLIKRIKL